jgi:hypothetical protein
MNLELVAVLATVVGLVFAAIQVWLAWKRHQGSDSGAAQPVREDAVTALTDTALIFNPLGAAPDVAPEALEDTLKAIDKQCDDLMRLHSRLKVASGIGDQEVEAFAEVANKVIALRETAFLLWADANKAGNAPDALSRSQLSKLGSERKDFFIARERFETVVSEAKTR